MSAPATIRTLRSCRRRAPPLQAERGTPFAPWLFPCSSVMPAMRARPTIGTAPAVPKVYRGTRHPALPERRLPGHAGGHGRSRPANGPREDPSRRTALLRGDRVDRRDRASSASLLAAAGSDRSDEDAPDNAVHRVHPGSAGVDHPAPGTDRRVEPRGRPHGRRSRAGACLRGGGRTLIGLVSDGRADRAAASRTGGGYRRYRRYGEGLQG